MARDLETIHTAVLILLDALAVTLMLVSDLMGGDESWVLHGWNKVIQNNQVDIFNPLEMQQNPGNESQ